jgi:hypothetical protein
MNNPRRRSQFIVVAATVFLFVFVCIQAMLLPQVLWCGNDLECLLQLTLSAIVPIATSTPESIRNSAQLLQSESSVCDVVANGSAYIIQLTTTAIAASWGDAWLARRAAASTIASSLVVGLACVLSAMRLSSKLDGALIVYINEMISVYVLTILACCVVWLFAVDANAIAPEQTPGKWQIIISILAKVVLFAISLFELALVVVVFVEADSAVRLFFLSTARGNELSAMSATLQMSHPLFPSTLFGGVAIAHLLVVFDPTTMRRQVANVRWLLLPGVCLHVFWCVVLTARVGVASRQEAIDALPSKIEAIEVAKRNLYLLVGVTLTLIVASAALIRASTPPRSTTTTTTTTTTMATEQSAQDDGRRSRTPTSSSTSSK